MTQFSPTETAIQGRLDALVTHVAVEFMPVSAASLQESLERALRMMTEFFDVDTSFLRRNDFDRDLTVLIAEWPRREHVPDPDPLGEVPFDVDPVFAATRELDRPFVLRPNASDDPYQERVERGAGVGRVSLAMVPLIRDGVTTSGVLGFVKFGDRSWDMAETNALQAVASLIVQLQARVAAEEQLQFQTEALRQSEERFRLLVDGVKDCAIFMLDPRGHVASWNTGAQRLFGYGASEIVGQSGAVLYTQEEACRGAPERALAVAEADGSSEQNGWRLHKDGSRFFADVVLTALRDEQGEVRSYSALVRDLTQRLKLEEQVRQAQKMEAIGRLAGGIAHDFNNLLAAIYGFVYHGLKRLTPESPVRTDLEQIHEAARRAGGLTAQLLSFARKQRVELRVFDLNELVLSMGKLLRRVLGDDVELVTLPSPDLGSVEADPGQIEQVILNLAVNARDAMPQGGALTIETSSVELGEDHDGTHPRVTPGSFAMLTLSDTGTGMTPEVLEHIFEPFFTTKGACEGTGLGLATSYGIVTQAGGYIGVSSEPGRGTTFKLYLPRSTKDVSLPLLVPVSSPSAQGETLLLVEDHAMLRTIATQELEALGYDVMCAPSGEDAIRIAAAHQGTIDLLVTDVVMPKMSGHELAQRLAALRPGLRVLYVSGYTENTRIRNGEPTLGTYFLPKPFTPDQLARKVRDVLDVPPVSRPV